MKSEFVCMYDEQKQQTPLNWFRTRQSVCAYTRAYNKALRMPNNEQELEESIKKIYAIHTINVNDIIRLNKWECLVEHLMFVVILVSVPAAVVAM